MPNAGLVLLRMRFCESSFFKTMHQYGFRVYMSIMKTEALLEKMGFVRRNHQHTPLVYFYEKKVNNIVIMVQVFSSTGRWEPFIVIRDNFEEGESHTAHRPLGGIKDLTDLEDFISYL